MSAQRGAVRPRSGQRNAFIFRLIDWLTAGFIIAALAAFILFVVYTPVSVKSSGVYDFNEGDLVFASRFSKNIFGLQRGDAVVVKAVEGANEARHIRRVTAFGGEKVVIAEGRVYVGGALVDESSYADLFESGVRAEFTVPTGSILALPDERSGLTAGDIEKLLVKLSDVTGEVRAIAYPPQRIRLFF